MVSDILKCFFSLLYKYFQLLMLTLFIPGKEIVIGCTSRAKSLREKQIGKVRKFEIDIHIMTTLSLIIMITRCHQFLIIECNEMNVKFEGGACESKIIHAKYSPCNKFFGLATEQGRIYIHRNDSKKYFNVEFIIDTNAGPISSFDFSSDSYLIRCSTFDYNLNYCKKQKPNLRFIYFAILSN